MTGSNRPPDRPEPSHGAAVSARVVRVPWNRLGGWIQRYESRHLGTDWAVTPTLVTATSADGSTVSFDVPLPPLAEPTMPALLDHLDRDWHIAVVLVRRGGFAVARLVGDEVVESKVGQRHVQGRTKAGGWSQHRFARRRDNQARAAFDAAAGYVLTLLVPHARALDLLVSGGDQKAAAAVLEMPELSPLRTVSCQWLAGLPDPRRSVLDHAVGLVRSVAIEIVDTAPRAGDPANGRRS